VRTAFGLICFRDIRCSFQGMIRGPIVFTIAHLIEKANFLHQRFDNGSHPPDVETIIGIG
jgi:hypothetical protein